MTQDKNNKIWIFADHFKIRYIGSAIKKPFDSFQPIEQLLNEGPGRGRKFRQLILVGAPESPVQIYERDHHEPYEKISESQASLIKTKRIDMIYDPFGRIYTPAVNQKPYRIKFRVGGLKHGLIGAVMIPGVEPNYQNFTDAQKLKFIYRQGVPGTLDKKNFVRFLNTRQRKDQPEFQRLFDRTPEFPMSIDEVLLNITDETVLSASIPY